jgi:Pyridine nucleotide-disulphide oxidoreductase
MNFGEGRGDELPFKENSMSEMSDDHDVEDEVEFDEDRVLHIAIIGAGPIGLEAALYARFLGYQVSVLEKGDVCDHVRRWGGTRLFTPFSMNSTPLALAALHAQDASFAPPASEALLSGDEWLEQYLLPLSRTDLLSDSIQTFTEVLHVARSKRLKNDMTQSALGSSVTFQILTRSASGDEQLLFADVLLDCSGVFSQPNWIGMGTPALGELDARLADSMNEPCDRLIEFGLPRFDDHLQKRLGGKSILLIGSGYSAATNFLQLAQLARQFPATRVTWSLRVGGGSAGAVAKSPRASSHSLATPEPYPRIPNDRLISRDLLAQQVNETVATHPQWLNYISDSCVQSITIDEAHRQCKVVLESASIPNAATNDDETESLEVLPSDERLGFEQSFDFVFANVGGRPDLDLFRELQVHLCYASEGPMRLAAKLLASTSTDCLDQKSHGAETLVTTEPGFFILGVKSYGRNSNFLLANGHDQIREAFSVIGERKELNLYRTSISHSGSPTHKLE